MIDDEQLTLYFYGDELSDDERGRIGRALEQDASLAMRYAALSVELKTLRRDVRAVDVSEDFTASLHDVLVQAQSPARAPRWRQWSLAASLLAAVVLATLLIPRQVPDEVVAAVTVPPVQSSPSQRIVVAHLAQSRVQLVRYGVSDAASRRELIHELVEQNRSIEHTAQRNGDEDLARVLRAFETVLERLADVPEQAAEREQLLDQLTFEVNAMLTKFDVPASDPSISF